MTPQTWADLAGWWFAIAAVAIPVGLFVMGRRGYEPTPTLLAAYALFVVLVGVALVLAACR